MSLALLNRVYMIAPVANQSFETRSGNVYQSDSTGKITTAVANGDVVDLLNSGCVLSTQQWLGRLIGANMNVTTDQAIAMDVPVGQSFRVTKVSVLNASVSLTTAAGGLYSAASKGGDAIVAAAQAYTALTTSGLVLDLTIATTPGKTQYSGSSLFFSLTTGQGAPATADIYVYGDVYW